MKQTTRLDSILIVDDTPVNIQVLVNALKEMYRIRVANNGLKAIAIAESGDPPDLILLDIMMPEMDGYEVCRRLKQTTHTMNIPIIFISTKDSSDDEAYGLNLGAVDYISKPFSLPVVKARVRTHVQLKQQTDRLEALAMVDSLTGIGNRRSFDQTLAQELRRARREAHHLGLIMIDIDEFKAYNDHYGHGVGDVCLQQVARALEGSVCRAGDFVGRYGGEEFVVVLPQCNLDGTLLVAEKIRQQVAALHIPHVCSQTADHVTVSLGCKVVSSDEKQPCVDLLREADQALYRAKEQGRNRVVAA